MSLKFYCNQCPASFKQLRSLIEHYETKHNPEKVQYQKLGESISYCKADSGCKVATEHLGSQSLCLECPFPECIYDDPLKGSARAKKQNRNVAIVERYKAGIATEDIASEFGVSIRTIQRVLRSL